MPPRLDDVLRNAWRPVVFALLQATGFIGLGVKAALDANASPGDRWLGAAAVTAGLLTGLSFWLYLRPGFLTHDVWRAPTKRWYLGVALRYGWMLMIPAAIIAWRVATDRA